MTPQQEHELFTALGEIKEYMKSSRQEIQDLGHEVHGINGTNGIKGRLAKLETRIVIWGTALGLVGPTIVTIVVNKLLGGG